MLTVRTGLRWTARVPRATIAGVDRRAPGGGEKPLRASLIGGPSLWLRLREPVTAEGPYGMTRSVSTIALAVDEPDRFLAALDVAS